MTVYTESAEAAKQAVLQALTDDLSVDTLQKLWDHYLGLRSIAETQNESTPLFTNSSYPEYIGGIGDDHISFDLGGESPCFVSDTSDINLVKTAKQVPRTTHVIKVVESCVKLLRNKIL